MPKKIDHEGRKQMILQTALKVFAREGYKNSNLSLIALECGISRPTIYQYFEDKEQIYYYAVKQVTGRMFNTYAQFAWSTDRPCIDRIATICCDIIGYAGKAEDELSNLMDVMLQKKREGKDFSNIVLRRTAKLTILFKRLLRQGSQKGEIVSCDVDKVALHLMMLLESTCFRVAFFRNCDLERDKTLIRDYLDSLRAESPTRDGR